MNDEAHAPASWARRPGAILWPSFLLSFALTAGAYLVVDPAVAVGIAHDLGWTSVDRGSLLKLGSIH